LEAQARLEVLLPGLPVVDASDKLVNRVLLAVKQEMHGPAAAGQQGAVDRFGLLKNFLSSLAAPGPTIVRHRRMLAAGATLVLAVVVGLAVLRSGQSEFSSMGSGALEQSKVDEPSELNEDMVSEFKSLGYVDGKESRGSGEKAQEGAFADGSSVVSGGRQAVAKQKKEGEVGGPEVEGPKPPAEQPSVDALRLAQQNRFSGSIRLDEADNDTSTPGPASAPSLADDETADLIIEEQVVEMPYVGGEVQSEFTASFGAPDARRPSSPPSDSKLTREAKEAPLDDKRRAVKKDASSGKGKEAGDGADPKVQGRDLSERDRWNNETSSLESLSSETSPSEITNSSRRAARDFLAERNRVEGFSFQDAEGYWSNAYVPGDPVLRLLQSRVEGQSRPAGQGLHENVQPAMQPFDVPTNAALAVYLQADQRSLQGETRTLVQVGLQGTERLGGRRPPLNLALVLDLTGFDPGSPAATETAATLRALVLALEEHRDTSDRFHLVVAGRPGGVIVEAEEFRHGRLLVALHQLFGAGGSMAKTLNLPAAVAAGVEQVMQGDDPNAPLGSNLVLLATPRSLGNAAAQLAVTAHQSAVHGVLVSTVGVGNGIDRGELDRIALAGQGNRRLMNKGSKAANLVERELASASRAVARAVRVRIRLAPGVRLVDVVGSRRLDALQAEKVREAEQGVDQQLARRMSIEADRGEDEEGIQIVIPSFYAGDSHVILLDVVASGPGAVADVTVRYKDLVYLRNGVARDQLSLPRGEESPGPLGLNVLENLLAYRLFETLEEAGNLVTKGQIEQAKQHLSDFVALLQGLREEVAGLSQDRDLASDLTLLRQYLNSLERQSDRSSGDADVLAQQISLGDSLRLAARLKILPQPLTWPTGEDE